MVMQAGLGLSRADTIAYARSMIDIVVQLDRSGGQRRIAAIDCIGTGYATAPSPGAAELPATITASPEPTIRPKGE